MARELNVEDLDEFVSLLQLYTEHLGKSPSTVDELKTQLHSGISNGSRYIIGVHSDTGEALGILIHNPGMNQISLFFAKSVFEVEKELFDMMFSKFSESSPTLIFESGYPTPWISSEFSEYAVQCGFVKHDRWYMRLQWTDFLAPPDLLANANILPLTESMIEKISTLVFRSVDGTIDQDLFPFVYGTYESTLKFHRQLYNGDFGTHKPSYSWVMKENDDYIGACFMTTWGVMHLAIAPEHRQRGLGRVLLVHSLHNLFKIEPELKWIDLVVTISNPATALYESLGFKKVNDSSTYVWKKT
ncbi:MAG: GNAT family N-acetyltransferase [Candidatus Thorarchaeota archaeon]